MVAQMIGIGEQTGALDAMLGKIADFYEEEVDAAIANLLTLIEPLLIGFLGVTHRFDRHRDVHAAVHTDRQTRRRRKLKQEAVGRTSLTAKCETRELATKPAPAFQFFRSSRTGRRTGTTPWFLPAPACLLPSAACFAA